MRGDKRGHDIILKVFTGSPTARPAVLPLGRQRGQFYIVFFSLTHHHICHETGNARSHSREALSRLTAGRGGAARSRTEPHGAADPS